MVFLKPKQVESKPVTNGNGKSRFQQILEHANAAHQHLDLMAHIFSTLIVDVEKGMSFVDKFRRDLTEAITEAGGSVDDSATIEEAISEFVPKNVRAAE